MKNIGTKIAAVAFVLLASTTAFAGKGGGASKIKAAVQSGSVDAIIAEVERAEALVCGDCIQVMTNLTEHDRYEVREVAGWWFAKRPAMAKMLAEGFVADLSAGGSTAVRNAADFLGATVTYTSLPQLRSAITRTDINAEAKLALVRAVRFMGHKDGNFVLLTAMGDADATVRATAVSAWREIRGQASASPAVALLSDSDANVRAEAATVVGVFADATGRQLLERIVASDASPFARRNAAWALGKIGDATSRDVLLAATNDPSGLVRMTAKAALATLR